MIEDNPEDHVSQLLRELGPADPPDGFVQQVMARISSVGHERITERGIPFNKGALAMTRKAMWGIAAAAAVVLGVLAVKGFPPVGFGTEGTIGAAKKYEAAQLTDKDVVLGDTAAQEFLQSDAFDRLARDPDARALLSDTAIRAQLKTPAFVEALRDANVRQAISSPELAKIFGNAAYRAALEEQLKSNASAAVRQVDMEENLKSAARAAVASALKDQALAKAMNNAAVRTALDDAAFRAQIQHASIAAAMRGAALESALRQSGFEAALRNGKLEAALASR